MDDDVMNTINTMLQLNGEFCRNLADVLHYHKVQAVSGTGSTAYKIYVAEAQRNFASMGELLTTLGIDLAGQ